MKKYICIMVAVLFIISCENTNENLVQERGVAVVPTMSDAVPAYFSDNIEASYIAFDISLPNGEKIDKAEIEVSRGDKSAILKEITLPATGLKVTAGEVIKSLNIPESDYHLGDVYNLYVLTTKNGKTTRSIAALSIPVVCYFESSMLTGSFDFISESWDEEGSIRMVADPDDPNKIYIQDYPEAAGLSGNGNRITLNFNPNNFNITGSKVIIADDLWGYHDYAFQVVSGRYSACEDTYTLVFAITVAEGSFGNFEFIFTRAH